MAGIFDKVKRIFSQPEGSSSPPSRETQTQARITTYLQMIREDDFEQIESARSNIQPNEVEHLIVLYWTLEKWEEKRALIELVQDQYSDEMPKMMLDFLQAPMVLNDDPVELAKAVALGFIDEKYDRFMTYYNDRPLLHRTVRAVLNENGLKQDGEQEQKKPASKPVPQQVDPKKSPNQRLVDGAWGGNLTAVKQALADGATLDVEIGNGDYKGLTALQMALISKKFDVADFLIDQGADVNHKRPAQHTTDRTVGQTPLWWAANHDHMELAQKLIQKGAIVNTPDHHGSTPLVQAASSGHLEMTQFLVSQGADVHAKIYDGRKGFNLAITHGHKRVAEYLLTLGNNPNEAGDSGYSPLMIAAENGFLDLAKILVRQGADVNAKHLGSGIYIALRGWTPLIFAVNASYVRMTKFLIQSGADVHVNVAPGQNYRGDKYPERGVLDFAKGKRAESIEKLLKDAGA